MRNNPLEVGDLALVVSEDCKDVGLMQMTGPSSGGTNVEFVHNTGSKTAPGNCTTVRWTESITCDDDYPTPGGLAYGPGSFLMQFNAIAYYIGTSVPRMTPSRHFIASGMRGKTDDEVTVVTDEIAVGVEDMQLLYGVDTESDSLANVYVRADDIDSDAGEWRQVVSVRVTLLMRGFGDTREGEGEVTNSSAYPYAGEDDTYEGQAITIRVLRQQVSKTVRIRNVGAG